MWAPSSWAYRRERSPVEGEGWSGGEDPFPEITPFFRARVLEALREEKNVPSAILIWVVTRLSRVYGQHQGPDDVFVRAYLGILPLGVVAELGRAPAPSTEPPSGRFAGEAPPPGPPHPRITTTAAPAGVVICFARRIPAETFSRGPARTGAPPLN